MNQSRERLFQLDYVRLAATLAVIMLHVSAAYMPANRGAYFFNQLVRFAVPLFFAVSGASLIAAYKYSLQTGPFYLGRCRRVVIPYLIWTAFYLASALHFQPGDIFQASFLADYGKGLLLGVDHLYFVIIMIQLYILYPLLLRIHRGGTARARAQLAGSLLISLAMQIIVYVICFGIYVFPAGESAYLYLLFPGWLFFMVLGMCWIDRPGHSQPQNREGENSVRGWKIPALPLVFGWTAALILVIADSLWTNTYGSSIKPSVMLYAVLSLPVLWQMGSYVQKKAPAKVREAIVFFSRQSFFIFLAHVWILTVLKKVGNQFIMPGIWNHVTGLLALFLLTVIITSSLAAILPRWRYSWLMGCEPGRKLSPG